MADAQATSRSPVVPIQPLSESSIALLRELVAHLRESRTQLREEWARRITEAQLLTAMGKQQEAIRVLSTPVLPVRERLLILPVIGTVDPLRARQLTEQLLRGIRTNRARVVVMDITGVPAMDATVANHLVLTVEASRLLGATVIVTGLSPELAQTLVNIGVDLSKMNTVGDLQGGIEEAERLLGYKVAPLEESVQKC